MEKLSFKPISEGLGFHPFSDGLPYAPSSKATTAKVAPQPHATNPTSSTVRSPGLTSGVGAVAAGLPRMRAPTLQTPRAVPVTPATPITAAPIPEFSIDAPAYGLSYLSARAAAYLLDTALIFSGFAAGISSYLAHFAAPSGREASLQDLAYIVLVLGSLHWALMTFQEVAFGTTVGKRVFGLHLHGGAAGVFLRAFFFVPSALCMGLGFLPVLIDRRRRCLHDLIVDIQPTWSNE